MDVAEVGECVTGGAGAIAAMPGRVVGAIGRTQAIAANTEDGRAVPDEASPLDGVGSLGGVRTAAAVSGRGAGARAVAGGADRRLDSVGARHSVFAVGPDSASVARGVHAGTQIA